MQHDYDLFEILPDQSIYRRACVRGTRHALQQLEIMGRQTTNECIATSVLTREVIGRVNRQAGARASG